MIGLRRYSFGVPLLLALALAGCSDSDPASPTSPSPTPAPPAATFSISGSVSETAPTAGTRVEGVQVSVTGGPSATTNAEGVFTITGVAAGSHTLTLTRTDYVTQTVPVSVTNANVSGIQVSLAPTPRTVREEHNATIRGDGPSCFGTSKSCHVYKTGTHNDGLVQAFMTWTAKDANFDLELRCNNEVVDESLQKEPLVIEMRTEVKGGQACELHVLFTGEEVAYGLFLSYPY